MAFEQIESYIELDLYDYASTPAMINAIALDNNARSVTALICERGRPYNIGQNANVVLTIMRPDKTGAQLAGQTHIITGKSSIDLNTTIYGVYAELTQSALSEKGSVKAQFKITSGNQVLRTEIFTISTGQALDADITEWTDYQGYNLDELIQSVTDLSSDVTEIQGDVSELKEGLNDRPSSIKQGENVSLTIEDGCIRKTLYVYTHANYYHANVPVQEGETYRVTCYSINSSDYPGVFAIVDGSPVVILGGTSTKYNGAVFTVPSGVTSIYINTISSILPIELFKITTNVHVYGTPRMYVALYNDAPKTAKVCYKNGNNDLVVTFGKNNANNLPDFIRFDAVANNTPEVGVALYGTNLAKMTTDFFAPYMVKAINNVDGDMPSGYSDDFTGGAHEYTNTGTGGTPTARCSSLEYFIDGRRVDNYCGYANNFRAKWTNLIQGNNTKKADGTGREILKEIHDMRFDGINWIVDVEIVPLEDLVIDKWYGLQIRHKGTSGTLVKYVGADNRQEYTGNVNSNSGATLTSGIIVDGDTYLPTTINVDVSVDLGKRIFYSGTCGAFTVGASKKTYFNIIENLSALRGNHYFMRGSYRFDLS